MPIGPVSLAKFSAFWVRLPHHRFQKAREIDRVSLERVQKVREVDRVRLERHQKARAADRVSLEHGAQLCVRIPHHRLQKARDVEIDR